MTGAKGSHLTGKPMTSPSGNSLTAPGEQGMIMRALRPANSAMIIRWRKDIEPAPRSMQ